MFFLGEARGKIELIRLKPCWALGGLAPINSRFRQPKADVPSSRIDRPPRFAERHCMHYDGILEGDSFQHPHSSMNRPRQFSPQQIATCLAFGIGVVVGTVTGYIAYAAGSGAEGAMSLENWLRYPFRLSGLWWAMGGGIIGVAWLYVKRHS